MTNFLRIPFKITDYRWVLKTNSSQSLMSHKRKTSYTFPVPGNTKTCNVGGKTLSLGERLKTADPCLECQCGNGGQLNCRLRVCPKLPRPPPPPCLLLQRPASCCPSMHCPQEGHLNEQGRSNLVPKFPMINQEGCFANGTVYGDGSAMVTSTLCEYCYCIRGHQHCVRPKCLLSVPGCEPEYAPHSCCPTKYVCSNSSTDTFGTRLSSTTTAPKKRPGSCTVGGLTFPEGERVTNAEKLCHICYCVKGKVLCDPVVCDETPPPNCSPVLSSSHCCPLSYNCSTYEETTVASSDLEMEAKEVDDGELTTVMDTTTSVTQTTTTADTEMSTTPMPTTMMMSTISENTVTTSRPPADSEERFAGSEIDSTETTTSLDDGTTTSLLLEVRNGAGKVKVTPDVIEAIINRTLAKDQDYEYDYNEPSLPPSLPNLKIIPFVAADAVLHQNEEDPLYAESNLKTSQYPDILKPTAAVFEAPVSNFFSPPVETEGGFVPKDPSLFDNLFLSGIKPDHILPPATESTRIAQTEGDTLKMTLPPHLRDSPTSYMPDSMSNLPAITVADGVVTPNPFKDVIKTELPPDLKDIMKDKPIHTTTAAALSATTTKPANVSAINSTTSIGPSFVKPGQTTTDRSTSVKSDKPKQQDNSTDYDYGENLSFGSVLDFLFSGGSTEKPKSTNQEGKPTVIATTSAIDLLEQTYSAESNSIVHKEAQDRSDVNISDPADELNAANNIFTPEQDPHKHPPAHKASLHNSLSGLLKLAGCNIYGRIYRVGRIIDELSNPCLECLCTELGVQCQKLDC